MPNGTETGIADIDDWLFLPGGRAPVSPGLPVTGGGGAPVLPGDPGFTPLARADRTLSPELQAHFGSPEAALDYVGRFSEPEFARPHLEQIVLEQQKLGRQEEGFAGGQDILAGLTTLLTDMYTDFEAQGPPQISEAEQSAMNRQLALGVNRAQGARAGGLRRAGLSGSGLGIGNDPLFTAIGSAAGGELSANIAGTNRALQADFDRFLADIMGGRTQLGVQQAMFETAGPTSDFDPFLASGFQIAQDLRQEGRESEERWMDIYEQSMQPGPFDFLNIGTNLVGSGLPKLLF